MTIWRLDDSLLFAARSRLSGGTVGGGLKRRTPKGPKPQTKEVREGSLPALVSNSVRLDDEEKQKLIIRKTK